MGLTTIALTGEGGGKLATSTDYLFAVPSRSTPLIQQGAGDIEVEIKRRGEPPSNFQNDR
jgi:hypothetical protein